jgi:hypothetical protein
VTHPEHGLGNGSAKGYLRRSGHVHPIDVVAHHGGVAVSTGSRRW